jgi:D-alanyl-lipoteichoic acid acyltransferase DltB (MBOAT superfamily)
MLMGFHLPKNFNSPYKAENAQQFWRRWHMSLSRWLRDYLYIPLGGNRNATWGTYIIIIAVAVIGSFLSGSWWVAFAVAVVSLAILLYGWRRPDQRKFLRTQVNSMDTMLLGGLWHGASWNFMIWGGLNGLGQIVYKFWAQWTRPLQTAVICGVCALCYAFSRLTPAPVWNLFFVWTLVLVLGTLVRLGYWCFTRHSPGEREPKAAAWIANAWAVFQTFVFITFTRLFFRSGSNLDPALANEQAWNTAKNMVRQIGSAWDLSIVPKVAWQHRAVLLVFLFGMLIHWLPERWKRRYRIRFATLPLGLMAVAVVAIVFVVYQFITAGLQTFIYFQF